MTIGSAQPVILWLQIGATEDDVGADNRNACDKGGFQGEGAQILRLQVVDVALAAGSRQHLYLHRHGVDEVGDAVSRFVDVEAFHQFGILRGDTHGAASGMAVVTGIWLRSQRVIIFDIDGAVAVERDQCAGADGDGVRAERQGFGGIHAAANTSGDDELYHAVHAYLT